MRFPTASWPAAALTALLSSAAGLASPPSFASETRALCRALEMRLSAVDGNGPALLASWSPGEHEDALPRYLAGAAHTYDNALAVMALIACGKTEAAIRIADALAIAAVSDRSGVRGRLRNAYRAGSVAPGTATPIMGWATRAGGFVEDAYAAGTTAGNAAWAALALLHAHKARGHARHYRAAAATMRWIARTLSADSGLPGFIGGLSGEEEPRRLAHRSTEHNTAVAALALSLADQSADPLFVGAASDACFFVRAMARPDGAVLVGTREDGLTPNTDVLALDALVLPALARLTPPSQTPRTIAALERFRAGDGFDFNTDRDGMWVEGTLQAAALLRTADRADDARRMIASALALKAESGLLYATDGATVSTGFYAHGSPLVYEPRPHVGATAWAILALTDTNPFMPHLESAPCSGR